MTMKLINLIGIAGIAEFDGHPRVIDYIVNL